MDISRSAERVDAPGKIAGITTYIGDIHRSGMLYAFTLRSTIPRGIITAIHVPPLPKGCLTVDHRDVPGRNRVKMIADDMPFFAEDRVRYIGEPILLVVGPDRECLARIMAAIEVEYEPLPPIATPGEAQQKAAPPIFGTDNLFAQYEITAGDPDRFMAGGAPGKHDGPRIITDEYRTGHQEHIYIEPQGVLGSFDGTRVTVEGSMQCPYYVKNALTQGLGWPGERVRVVQTTTGGAFGGKEEYPSLIAGHAAFAAVKARKPVKLVFNRGEDICCTTKRHPSIISFRTALDPSSGRIIAMTVDVVLDGGAYAGLTAVVLQRAMFAATGVYRIPNIRVKGRAYATNTVPTGAFRGFGGPQAFFAIEMHMHHAALQIGEDPLVFKGRHLLRKGDKTNTGGTLRDDVKLKEMIEKARTMSCYEAKYARSRTQGNIPAGHGDAPLQTPNGFAGQQAIGMSPARGGGATLHSPGGSPKRQGIGMSLFFHGCGFTGSGEKDQIKARAKLRKTSDGQVEILVSSVEMGQGAQTTLRKIVAGTLDIPLTSVLYDNPDTDRVPDSGPTAASRTVMIVGQLLEQAALKLESRWDEAGELEVVQNYTQPDYLEWDKERLEGDAYPTYAWGVNVVEVSIDPDTFETQVEGIWAVYDLGTPIDDGIVRGQIEGGIMQGLGYASLEVMDMDQCRIKQDSITDYIIPTSLDFPNVESHLIQNPYAHGPFGAKGVGELPLIGAAPAFAAALQNALNVPIRKIPATPEYLAEVTASERED